MYYSHPMICEHGLRGGGVYFVGVPSRYYWRVPLGAGSLYGGAVRDCVALEMEFKNK